MTSDSLDKSKFLRKLKCKDSNLIGRRRGGYRDRSGRNCSENLLSGLDKLKYSAKKADNTAIRLSWQLIAEKEEFKSASKDIQMAMMEQAEEEAMEYRYV